MPGVAWLVSIRPVARVPDNDRGECCHPQPGISGLEEVDTGFYGSATTGKREPRPGNIWAVVR
jgi:hypothetical protein